MKDSLKTLAELIKIARALPPMTREEVEEQAVCFAYGNLACTTNHKPVRAAFETMCLGRGWSKERFAAWAKDREWR